MRRIMLKSKIHRARVTGAALHYEGSLTIDPILMRQADILPHESVEVWNVTSGTRIRTYAIPGIEGLGEICANGAAAHQIKVDDLLIIATFTEMEDEEARKYEPIVVMVDKDNRIVCPRHVETPGPRTPASRSDI